MPEDKTPEQIQSENNAKTLNEISADESDANADVSRQGEENLAHEDEVATSDAVPVTDDSKDKKDNAAKDDDKKSDNGNADNKDNASDDKKAGADDDKKKDGDDSDDTAADDKGDNKQHRSAQKRINEAVKKQRAAERKELDARREAEALRRKLADIEKGGGQDSSNEDSKDDDKPKEKPKQEDFESYDDYVEALTDWKVDQKTQTTNKKESSSNNDDAGEDTKTAGIDETVLRNFEDQVDAAKDKYDDYEEKVYDESLSITPEMFQVIANSDHGAEIAYALANNPEQAHKIAQLGDNVISIAREIGKVEASLNLSTDDNSGDDAGDGDNDGDGDQGKDKQTPAKKTTNAPDPIEPGGTKEPGRKNPDEETMDEYRARREKEERAAGNY